MSTFKVIVKRLPKDWDENRIRKTLQSKNIKLDFTSCVLEGQQATLLFSSMDEAQEAVKHLVPCQKSIDG